MKKYYFLLAIFLSTAIAGNAQNFAWVHSAGGDNVETTTAVAADAAGNSFAVGYYRSASVTFGSFTLTSPGTANHFFVVKYDAAGTVLWAKAAPGLDQNEADAATIDPSGNIIVTGFYENTMSLDAFTINSSSSAVDMFVAKYDTNGNVIWLKSAGGTNTEFPKGIVTDASGNIFITGQFSSSPMILDSYSLPNAGLFDIFIAKYDPSGNVLWATSNGTAMYEGATAITADASGNIFVGGYYENSTLIFGTDTLRNDATPYHGVFLVKYNNVGVLQWAKCPGGGGELQGLASSGGDVYVTGYFSDSIIFGASKLFTPHYYSYAFVAKYDSGGNAIWAQKEGSSIYNYFSYSIASDAMSNIYITGSDNAPSATLGGSTFTNAGGTDIFVIKYDSDGTPLWSQSAGGDQDDESFAVACNTTGVFVGGEFASTVFNAGSFSMSNAGAMDMFIAKLSPDATTGVTSFNNTSGATVFPNPSTGLVTIHSDYPADAAISIYDMLGKCMYENTAKKNSSRDLDLSGLPKGIYFMKIISAEKKEVKKIVLE